MTSEAMEREMEEAQRELAERRVVSERRQTSHKIAQPGYTKRFALRCEV